MHSYPPAAITAMLVRASTVQELLRLQQRHSAGCNAINISRFWQTLGKLTRQEEEMRWLEANQAALEPARMQTLGSLSMLSPIDLAHTAHGAASARVGQHPPWDVWWQELGRTIVPTVDRLPTRNLKDVVWSFAAARVRAPELFRAVKHEVRRRDLKHVHPSVAAHMAWSFATVGHAAPNFLKSLLAVAEPRLQELSPHELAALCDAVRRAKIRAPHFFSALAEHTPSRLAELSGRESSSILSACIESEALPLGEAMRLIETVADDSVSCPCSPQ